MMKIPGIKWALNIVFISAEDMGIKHSASDIFMTQQLLNGTNITTIL